MTFNVWNAGDNVENGVEKIARHISLINPDVVALQESVTRNPEIVRKLGHPWVLVPGSMLYAPSIFTRHSLVSNSTILDDKGIGADIQLANGKVVNVWSLHLSSNQYGPDYTRNGSETQLSDIIAQEKRGRGREVQKLLSLPIMQEAMKKSSSVPIFIVGDFNSPSHMDWTAETKEKHGGWVVQWPVTKLMEENGFVDTYRNIYPNVSENPGITWSTVVKFNTEFQMPEPQDRIDYLFYQGPVISKNITVYSGNKKLEPKPNHEKNDYPSEHYAVYADYFFN